MVENMDRLKSESDLKLEEEFNNFMYKVNEVSNIMKKLTSSDKKEQEIGDQEAKKYLGEDSEKILENIDEEEVVLNVKSSKTILNKNILRLESMDQATMSQEAFKKEVSKDAEKRYRDKMIRKEKMGTFKKQANAAFKRGEYEKALTLYNKAIEQIKDCCLLYNNRALTCIHLNLYSKAKEDLKEWALRLNEDCLKSWLLLAKVHFLENDLEEFHKAVAEATKRNPDDGDFIKG
nr:unnamed protein product [Callosobruchus analis]